MGFASCLKNLIIIYSSYQLIRINQNLSMTSQDYSLILEQTDSASSNYQKIMADKNQPEIMPHKESIQSKSFCELLPINLTLCLSGFYFGYIVVYLSAVNIEVLKKYYSISMSNSLATGILNGVVSFGGAIGCVLASGFINFFSRKNSILVTGYLAIAANGIVFIPNLFALIISRVIQGICLGLYCTIVPMYMREFWPTNYSGTFGVMFQTLMALGTFLCFLLVYVLASVLNDQNLQKVWFFVFGFPLLTLVIQALLMNTIYAFQTPKYLIINQREQEAKKLLKHIYLEHSLEQVYLKLKYDYCGQQIYNQQFLINQTRQTEFPNSILSASSNLKIQKTPKTAIITAFFMSFSQQMIGIGSIVIYGGKIAAQVLPSLKRQAGFIINLPQILGAFLLSYLLSKYNQKTILQTGMILLFLLVTLIAVSFSQIGSSSSKGWRYTILVGQFFYNGVYACSAGSMLWVIMPAIVQPSIISYATLMNWVSSAIVLIGFPIIKQQVLGSDPMWLFVFFAIYTFLSTLMYQKLVIEIRNKSQTQIRTEYEKMDTL